MQSKKHKKQEKPEYLNLESRKPGWPDYSLIVLRDSQRLGITIAAISLCAFAVIANFATIVVNLQRKIRPFFRTCLLSLACSDLLTSIFQTTTYVSQLSNQFTPVWVLGELMCSFTPFVTTLAILVNSFTLVGIAVDRYLAIVSWMKGTWEPSKLFCAAGAVFVWGLAAGISSPMISSYYILEFFIMETNPGNQSEVTGVTLAEMCTSDKGPNQYYYSTIFSVIFLPLLIAFLWLNTILAKEIFSRRRPIPTMSNSPALTTNEDQSGEKRTSETNTIDNDLNGTLKNGEKSSPQIGANGAAELSASTSSQSFNLPEKRSKTSREIRQIRMFKAIIFIMITFFVCRLPTWIFLLYKLFNVASSNLHWMLQYCFGLLSILNCVLNPILYTFLTETIQYSSMFVSKVKAFLLWPCIGRRSANDAVKAHNIEICK